MKNYSGALVDLIVFTLGVVNGSIDTWKKTVYNKEIEEAGDFFINAIAGGTDNDMKSALQWLIFAIFNQKRIGMADKYSSLVYSFIVLYSFRREGHLSRCNEFTQYISRVIWFGRVSIYNKIKEETKETAVGFFEYVFLSSETSHVLTTAIASSRTTNHSFSYNPITPFHRSTTRRTWPRRFLKIKTSVTKSAFPPTNLPPSLDQYRFTLRALG